MKIKAISREVILFDNGCKITYDHFQECCEENYADFNQLEDTGIETEDFKEPLTFESVENGFRFGNPGKMYYVPCYSEQNGYYTSDVDIYYNGDLVCSTQAEEIII